MEAADAPPEPALFPIATAGSIRTGVASGEHRDGDSMGAAATAGNRFSTRRRVGLQSAAVEVEKGRLRVHAPPQALLGPRAGVSSSPALGQACERGTPGLPALGQA